MTECALQPCIHCLLSAVVLFGCSYGYDKYGYGKDGYDKYGYDQKGYDKYGYNKEGYGKDGHYKEGYSRYVSVLMWWDAQHQLPPAKKHPQHKPLASGKTLPLSGTNLVVSY